MTITRTIGGVERRFGLLSVDDLMSLTDTIPLASGEIVDLRGLDKWSKSPRGAEYFLEMSARKVDRAITRDTVGKWGTIMERCNLAAEIFGLSITTGEEAPGPKVEGASTSPQIGN
jgi:hypothetical protein